MAQSNTTLQRRKLGKNGPELSVIGYGGGALEGEQGEEEAPDEERIAPLLAAFDGGVNWVDTAEGYGRSEELIGQAIRDRDILICSKTTPLKIVDGRPWPIALDAAELRSRVQASLQRLGRDSLDVYLLHFPPPGNLLETTWEAMTQLAEDGLVRCIGLCNCGRAEVERCEAIRHVDTVEVNFSVLYQEPKQELVPYCQAEGIGVLCFGALRFGVLSGAGASGTRAAAAGGWGGLGGVPSPRAQHLFSPERLERNRRAVEALTPIADRLGITMAQLALAWTIQQDGVTSAIVGSRSPTRMQENVSAASVRLSPEALAEIDRVVSSVSDSVA